MWNLQVGSSTFLLEASYQLSFIFLCEALVTVTYSCREFNIPRTVYYKWLKRFNKLGYLGLQDKEKAKPRMPNQIKRDKEKIILNYIIEYPTHGPKRIANELRQQGMTISDTGVYHVLRRKSLNRPMPKRNQIIRW